MHNLYAPEKYFTAPGTYPHWELRVDPHRMECKNRGRPVRMSIAQCARLHACMHVHMPECVHAYPYLLTRVNHLCVCKRVCAHAFMCVQTCVRERFPELTTQKC